MTTAVDTGKTRVAVTDREERLINSFFVIYRNARVVEANNRAFVKQCAGFYENLRSFTSGGNEISIKAVNGRYFANEQFVRFDDNSGAGRAICAEWEILGIGGVRFLPEVSEADIREFFSFMASLAPRAIDLSELQKELDSHVPATIYLLGLPEEPDEDDDENQHRRQMRLQARTTFFRAISVVEEIVSHSAVEREINLSKTRRVVHSLIDHVMRDQDSLLELAAIKDFDDYTYAHSINVSVYSLTLGTNLGMDRPRLSQLGFAALFHDIGKVRLDRDLIQKPDSFDENDWIQMQRHPILGAKTILRTLRFDEHSVRAARGALEHHINADFTGYPSLRDRRPLNLFSRIITIADTFDALTSGRVYFKKSIPPDQVIKKMRYQMGMKFDVTLLELFNRIIGIYPVGSVVLLNTDEIAIIVAANEGQYDRPQVQIIGNRDGILGQAQLANLANAEHLHRHIVRIVEPDRYGINVRDFILAEI